MAAVIDRFVERRDLSVTGKLVEAVTPMKIGDHYSIRLVGSELDSSLRRNDGGGREVATNPTQAS